MRSASEAVAEAKKALADVDSACGHSSRTLTKESVSNAKAEMAKRLSEIPGVVVVSLKAKS